MTAQPKVVLATPRKLPKPASLQGRVAVLDIAFAAEGTGSSFDKVTGPFLEGLGARLATWIDHHDHPLHARFANDPRFVLCRKADHGACPEMVTPERVKSAGPVDTIVCHNDLDGLYAAAKFMRGGLEPYPGADDDARAVDTRMGSTSTRGTLLDEALRGEPRDEAIRQHMVAYLVDGAKDVSAEREFEHAAQTFRTHAANARTLAEKYEVHGSVAVVDATGFAQRVGPYDKTLALLLGQERARVAVVIDDQSVAVAAAFDSGINLLSLLGIEGGMPTRVSVPRARLDGVLAALRGV